MLLDLNLQFSNAQAITGSAASTGVYDLATGLMVTGTVFTAANALKNVWGTASVFGEDIGIGAGVGNPKIVANVIQAFNNLTTLQIQLQAAPDTGGSTNTISGLTFHTMMQTDALPLALLTANTLILSEYWPRRRVGDALPRFIRLNYVVVGTVPSTGTITADVSVGGVDDATNTLQQYPANFTVAA